MCQVNIYTNDHLRLWPLQKTTKSDSLLSNYFNLNDVCNIIALILGEVISGPVNKFLKKLYIKDKTNLWET